MVLTGTKDDPSVRMLRSGIGKQVKSDHESAPEWGFGTGHRDAADKLYLSAEQAKAMHVSYSQGPVYKAYSAIGPQPESKFRSASAPGFGSSGRSKGNGKAPAPGPGSYQAEGGIGPQKESKRSTSPRIAFGTATRDQQSKVWLDDELMKTYAGRESPGPNNYAYPPAIGKQADSKYASAPSWRQGSSDRFKYKDWARDVPGAGTYKTFDALGRQTLSSKKTLPSAKIGTGTRDAFKKIFISKEHEKGAFGENSPGPVTSQFVSSIGTQRLSVKSSAPSWGFGSSKRPPLLNTTGSPGPGAYYA